ALTAIYGRLRTTDDVVANVPRVGGSAEIRETRFETISDTVTGFGDLSPQVSLRWTAGVHNLMTYATGNIPVGVYFAPLQYGHRTWRVGRRCRLHLFQRADGIRILGGGGINLQLPQSVHPVSERRRCASRLGRVAVSDQAAPSRLGGLPLQSSELRWRARRPSGLLPVARCRRRRADRLYRSHGGPRGKRERQSL